MSRTSAASGVRELDHRTTDGIEVRVLWNSLTSRVAVAVKDTRTGESFELHVPGADALNAFRHPFAYASHDAVGRLAA